MSEPRITIQRLAIRTRGLSEQTVREALSDLGPALQAAFENQPSLRPHESLNLDTLKIAPIHTGPDPSQLRQTLANQIATQIAAATDAIYYVSTPPRLRVSASPRLSSSPPQPPPSSPPSHPPTRR